MSLVYSYKSLADESRLRLVHVLGQGSFNVQELTSVVDLSQPTVSHHLKVLQKAGIVRSHKEGTWVYYSLSTPDRSTAGSMLARNFLELIPRIDDSSEFKEICERDGRAVSNILRSRHERTRDFFESVAHDWQNIRSTRSPYSYLDKLQAAIPADQSLLELGCGSGALLDLILPRSGKTFGVDYSQAMLDMAGKVLKERARLVDLRLGYLEHLPLGDSTVDIAVAHMVFHHLPEPRAALSDAFRVLRPDGKLLIVDLTPHSDESMREQQADLWLGFEPELFKRWCLEIGFKDCNVEFLGEDRSAFLLTATKQEG